MCASADDFGWLRQPAARMAKVKANKDINRLFIFEMRGQGNKKLRAQSYIGPEFICSRSTFGAQNIVN